MRRLLYGLVALAALCGLEPKESLAQAIVTLQTDANGIPVQSFFRLGSPHTVTYTPSGMYNVTVLNTSTRLVWVTCTTACSVVQRFTPARAFSGDFQLPANVLLMLKVQNGDSIAFVGTAGTAFVVELQ